jgi:branched-chain amino acid transport system substrate-binding protein
MNERPIRIGFCTDLSGPYESVDGNAGAEAVRMAIEDIGDKIAGRSIELLLADHHNDESEAARIANHWCVEANVDMVISGVNSATSLALTAVAAENKKLVMVVGAGTSVQTQERSTPTVVQYAYNTVSLATVPGLVLTRQGFRRWFYVTADYPFGRELQKHGVAAVKAAGGTVVGSVVNPHGAHDFTPFLEGACDTGAQVLGIANGHAELVNAMNTLEAMGIADRMKRVGLLTFLDDIHQIGLPRAQGLYLADSWFWTRDSKTREWAGSFLSRTGRMPSSLQAADYSATTQYLRALAAVGDMESERVIRYLRSVSLDDLYVRNGRIREDGTMLHDMYLLRVKTPEQSTEAWDYYDLIDTVCGEEAFPLGET